MTATPPTDVVPFFCHTCLLPFFVPEFPLHLLHSTFSLLRSSLNLSVSTLYQSPLSCLSLSVSLCLSLPVSLFLCLPCPLLVFLSLESLFFSFFPFPCSLFHYLSYLQFFSLLEATCRNFHQCFSLMFVVFAAMCRRLG